MVKRYVTVLVLMIIVLLTSCSNHKENIKDEITSEPERESTYHQETTTSLNEIEDGGEKETQNSATEEETLYWDVYDDDDLENMAQPIYDIMTEEMRFAVNDGLYYEIGLFSEEIILFDGMELVPAVDNEVCVVTAETGEYYDDENDIYIQMIYPYVSVKGNENATEKINEEIRKLLLLNRYDNLSDKELLDMLKKGDFTMTHWFSYYSIGYMDNNIISFMLALWNRDVVGLTFNLTTGEVMTLEDMGLSNEELVSILQNEPDHSVSDYYLEYSKRYIEDIIADGHISKAYFIKNDRLYLGGYHNRTEYIYLGYDNVLLDIYEEE